MAYPHFSTSVSLSVPADYLGDDDVPIRFVCTQSHSILKGRPSSIVVIKPVHSSFKFELVDNAMDRVRPYVFSVALLKWAMKALGVQLNKRLCYAAIEVGVLEVVQWLRSRPDACFPWRVSVCSNAAVHGHLDLLKWLRSQDPPCPWTEDVCKYAAWKGRLEIMKWARSQSPPCPRDLQQCVNAAWGLEEKEREQMVDWLQKYDCLEHMRQPTVVGGWDHDPREEVGLVDSVNSLVL
jgi:hypothetical protein